MDENIRGATCISDAVFLLVGAIKCEDGKTSDHFHVKTIGWQDKPNPFEAGVKLNGKKVEIVEDLGHRVTRPSIGGLHGGA